MSIKNRAKHILTELKGHMPFTILGALLGILFMFVFHKLSGISHRVLFSLFHPAHVILSAMVTASMFKLHVHKEKKQFLLILLIGYFGSVGIATLSDIVIPHIGSELLGLNVPTHQKLHHQPTSDESDRQAELEDDDANKNELHLGFIEEWYIVNPAAVLGVVIAFFLPRTKFPHTGHVLISTWASSSYLLMTMQSDITLVTGLGIFITLFLAVWLPCCISDIVFPLLFVKSDLQLTETCTCPVHAHHSHPHKHEHSDKCPTGKEKKNET